MGWIHAGNSDKDKDVSLRTSAEKELTDRIVEVRRLHARRVKELEQSPREGRYDVQKMLDSLAEQVIRATSLEEVATLEAEIQGFRDPRTP